MDLRWESLGRQSLPGPAPWWLVRVLVWVRVRVLVLVLVLVWVWVWVWAPWRVSSGSMFWGYCLAW